jgi:transcriptional antiterminator NusG
MMSEEKEAIAAEAELTDAAAEETPRSLSPLVDFSSVLSQIEETEEPDQEEVTVEEAPPAVGEEGPPDLGEDRAWYVIHCYSGYENKVKYNLLQRIETMQMQDQIFAVEVPTEDEIEVKEGKRRTVQRRIFPGYILVQMKMNDDSWYVVRNTPGVTGFVGMGTRPTPLRTEEVHGIMRRMEAEAPKIKVTFRSGQKVRIIDGPFNDFMGIVDEIDIDRAKVRVFVSFFGRETPVELDFLQVEKM